VRIGILLVWYWRLSKTGIGILRNAAVIVKLFFCHRVFNGVVFDRVVTGGDGQTFQKMFA